MVEGISVLGWVILTQKFLSVVTSSGKLDASNEIPDNYLAGWIGTSEIFILTNLLTKSIKVIASV